MPPARQPTGSRSYVLISPCRNEAKYAYRTLASVAAQTVPPALWIVVDDGSTDETAEILREFSQQHAYLRVVSRQNRGFRSVGPGVMDAFYAGLDTVDLGEFDYLCKLDLDVELPATYFELLLDHMEQNPRLGTCSGKPFFRDPQGRCLLESCGDEMSVGMTKFYRRECFQEIGGFVREVMWDGIDCHRCRMLGWQAASFADEALRFEHLRPMGSSQDSLWTGRERHGFGQYFMGTSPLYLLASACFRFSSYPYVVGSAAMIAGYIRAAIRKTERYGDEEFRHFLRRSQWESLIQGKTRAYRRIDERQEHVWRRRHQARTQPVDLPQDCRRNTEASTV